MKVYQAISARLGAIENCKRSGNLEWDQRHRESLESIVKDSLPSGSGIDNGTRIDMDRSSAEKIVLHTSFHHMDDGGGYDGWTDHTVIVKPSLAFGILISVTGHNRNRVKEYLDETYRMALDAELLAVEQPKPEGPNGNREVWN
jgi:hypothetical protein